MFQPFQTPKRCGYNCTIQLFPQFILKISRFSPFFSTLFHCSSSKFTTTTAQFPLYNCKLHFYNCTNCHQLHVKIIMPCLLLYGREWLDLVVWPPSDYSDIQ